MAEYILGSGLEVPGLEAIIEYNGLSSINDRSKLERLVATSLGGINDDADIRETREPNPDRAGEHAGLQQIGGRTITIEGRIRAGSIPAMRDTWRKVKTAFNGSENDLILHVPNEVALVYNYVNNPSAELTASDAAFSGAGATLSRDTSQFFSGLASYKLTAGAGGTVDMLTGSALAVAKPGQKWSASAWVKANTTGRSCSISVIFFNSSFALTTVAGSTFTDVSSDWTRVFVDGLIAPPDTVSVGLQVRFTSVGAGEIHFVDSIMLAQANTAPVYFDGDSPGAWWIGIAHNSRSASGSFDVNYTKNVNAIGTTVFWTNSFGGSGTTYPIRVANDPDFGTGGGAYSAINATNTSPATFTLLDTSADFGTKVRASDWWAVRAKVKITNAFLNSPNPIVLKVVFRNGALSIVSTVTIMSSAALQSYAAGSIIELKGVVQAPATARWMTFLIDSAVSTSASGGAVVGELGTFPVAGSTSAVPDYFDGTYRHCAWHGSKGNSESIKRRPRPFVIKRVRKSDKLTAPEKQSNDRAERDIMIVARAANPRIHVVDERSKWLSLTGTPNYVSNVPGFTTGATPPTGYTSIKLDTGITWLNAGTTPGILLPGVAMNDSRSAAATLNFARAYRSAEGYTYMDPVVRLQGNPAPQGAGAFETWAVEAIIKRIDNTNYIGARWHKADVGGFTEDTLSIFKVDGGTETILDSVLYSFNVSGPSSTEMWLVAYANGNFVKADIYNIYPASILSPPQSLASVGVTLGGADATKFGTAVSGTTGIGMGGKRQSGFNANPWIGRFESGNYLTMTIAQTMSIGVIGDFPQIVPKLVLMGDVVNPSLSVALPSGETKQIILSGTFTDTTTLDFDASTFETIGGTDRWDTWSPFSDFVGFESGINTISVLATGWTSNQNHVGLFWRDSYK